MKSALRLAILQLREKRRPNDHKFESIPTKHLWISDIGGRKGGRLLYFLKDSKLIIWGIGSNHDIEDEAVRFFDNKLREKNILNEELSDITIYYLTQHEEQELKEKTKVFAGNISDEFLSKKLFLSEYDISQVRSSNEISMWNLKIPDSVKFKLMQYLKLPSNVLLSAKDETHLDKFIKGSVDKLLIHLDQYQEQIVNERLRKPLLLHGETGSGKTTILIYKAIYYAEEHPDQECILFTYNLSLANLIKEAVIELTGSNISNLQIYGLYAWIEEITQLQNSSFKLIERDDNYYLYDVIEKLYTDVDCKKFRMTKREFNLFLKHEIEDVILSYDIKTLNSYLMLKRNGAERRIGKIQRKIVWSVFKKYLHFLAQNGFSSYKTMINEFLDEISQKDFLFKKDAIFVDEVQDLSPAAIQIISKLRRQNTSLVVIAGDYKQSIYRKSFSWNDVALPFFGSNVKILRKNYRNTEQILFPAHEMLEKFIPKIKKPLHCGRQGKEIEFIEYQQTEYIEKIKSIVNYLNIEENISLSDIAIFSPSRRINDLAGKLNDLGTPAIFIRQMISDDIIEAVRVSTLHSAKGLEFRAVIIIDAEKDLMSFKCDNEKLKAQIAAKLLYVGMTRAYDCLFFLWNPNIESNKVFDSLIEKKR
jgi:DNA polymerase III delta prime subunit